jgi:carboxymuconolactone decarboxylase family protein
MAIANSGHIEPGLSHLVDIRASQMNGCAFCLNMHVKDTGFCYPCPPTLLLPISPAGHLFKGLVLEWARYLIHASRQSS